MILTTHAITGAAIASAMPNHPVLGFVAGFASHFLLDSIPHYDYKLHSCKEDLRNPLNNDLVLNKKFVVDLIKICADGLFGVLVSLLLFFNLPIYQSLHTLPVQTLSLLILHSAVFWGIVGALLPDFLQFVYFKFRHEPFLSIQKFHNRIQIGKHLEHNHALGRILQIIIIVIVVAIFKFLV
jgi:hypothetical protein